MEPIIKNRLKGSSSRNQFISELIITYTGNQYNQVNIRRNVRVYEYIRVV